MMRILKKQKMPKIAKSEPRSVFGIEYTLERKRIKRLHLYVKPPDGEVLVTAPLMMSDYEIERFIADKADWIRKHTAKFRERPAQAKMSLEYKTGEILYFWGVPYRLTVVEEAGRKKGRMTIDPAPSFSVSDDELEGYCKIEHIVRFSDETVRGIVYLTVPAGSTFQERERIVKRKYKEILEGEAERILDFWSYRTGLRYSSWHSRYMKTRWGSLLVQDKRVCLNTRLAEKPEVCLIYIALHEIAHVKEANHGAGFKAILNKYMPCWRDAERILKS